MDYQNLYRDIAERTRGDIYIGDTSIIGLNILSRSDSAGLVQFFAPRNSRVYGQIYGKGWKCSTAWLSGSLLFETFLELDKMCWVYRNWKFYWETQHDFFNDTTTIPKEELQ